MFRQGDVFLVARKPSAKVVKVGVVENLVLVHGETTGHKHTLVNAQWLVQAASDIDDFRDGKKINGVFVEVMQNTILTHEEHQTLEIPAGIYEVCRQRQYTPQAIRPVYD